MGVCSYKIQQLYCGPGNGGCLRFIFDIVMFSTKVYFFLCGKTHFSRFFFTWNLAGEHFCVPTALQGQIYFLLFQGKSLYFYLFLVFSRCNVLQVWLTCDFFLVISFFGGVLYIFSEELFDKYLFLANKEFFYLYFTPFFN